MGKLPYAFSPETMAALAEPATVYDPRDAELVPDVEPRWYIVEVWPGKDKQVADDLIARKFGIFVPECDETIFVRRRKIERRVPMFPGYIFVFVWDVIRHLRRLASVPGVMRLVMVNGKPRGLTDGEIDLVRSVENEKRPLIQSAQVSQKRRRYGRKYRSHHASLSRDEIVPPFEIVVVRPWSAFEDGFASLDSETRNQTLRHALGLCS